MISIGQAQVLALTPTDRHEILNVLGLGRLRYRFEERVGAEKVRSWRLDGAQCVAEFPLERVQEPGDPTLVDAAFGPVLLREHHTHHLAEVPLFAEGDLWSHLLPFPFRLWGEPPSGAEASGTVSCADSAWVEAAAVLRAAFSTLQAKLKGVEVSVLEIYSPSGACVTLFFHCVRGRFPVLGRLHGVATEGGSDAEAGGDEPLSRLGASYQRLRLLAPAAGPAPLDLARALSDAVDRLAGATSPVAPAPESGSGVVIRTDS